jgi:uncharacterized protein YlxW (UPF0749 family)
VTDSQRSRRRRLRAGAVIGVLTALLGFAIAVQVHANSGADSLANLRDEDLIGILDNQDARADRLRQQISDLERTLAQLRNSGDRSAAARRQAKQDAQSLAVLLGTVAAKGPGVVVTITDPGSRLSPEDLLDVVEELRGASAEAIQFGSVRVSTDTAFTGRSGAVVVGGKPVAAPYRVLAIGPPKTMDTALNIPGGVGATVRAVGGALHVVEQRSVRIGRVRTLPVLKYARPSGS